MGGIKDTLSDLGDKLNSTEATAPNDDRNPAIDQEPSERNFTTTDEVSQDVADQQTGTAAGKSAMLDS
jgi:hypothetical protein